MPMVLQLGHLYGYMVPILKFNHALLATNVSKILKFLLRNNLFNQVFACPILRLHVGSIMDFSMDRNIAGRQAAPNFKLRLLS